MVLKFLIPHKSVNIPVLIKKVITNGRNFVYKFFVDF